MPRRYADRSGFVVRILGPATRQAVGIGFLVDDSRLVTCAHVVNMALGRDAREQAAPDAELRLPVDFPILGDADGDFVTGVCFVAPSGSRLIIQGQRSIRVLATDTAALVTEAKARPTRELTDSERRRHLPSGPYSVGNVPHPG